MIQEKRKTAGGNKKNPADLSEQNEQYVLPATYYSLKNKLTAILMLNNKGALALEVTPIFYSLNGTKLKLAPITVDGASYLEIEIRKLLKKAGKEFREGNLQIVHRGKEYQLGSQVKLIDAQQSLIWEEQQFVLAAKYISSRLEGVWYLPSKNCETKFVMTNTTDAPVTATVTIDGTNPKQLIPAVILLGAHQTKVLDVLPDLVGITIGTLDETGGVSISHTGAAGAVMARMLISKTGKGFSSTMTCIDPQMTASSRWHGAGLRLGKIGKKNSVRCWRRGMSAIRPLRSKARFITRRKTGRSRRSMFPAHASRRVLPQ